jgi:hypothetical protein
MWHAEQSQGQVEGGKRREDCHYRSKRPTGEEEPSKECVLKEGCSLGSCQEHYVEVDKSETKVNRANHPASFK